MGNKVFFAGGDQGFNGSSGIDRSRQVDIYDLTTNDWSTASLSERKRGEHVAVTVDNKIFFAGGETWVGNYWMASNEIDIYDNTSNTWSTASMYEEKLNFAGIAVGDKIFWAGGVTGRSGSTSVSCLVEKRDAATGTRTIEYLLRPAEWSVVSGQNAVLKDDKILFCRGLPRPSRTMLLSFL